MSAYTGWDESASVLSLTDEEAERQLADALDNVSGAVAADVKNMMRGWKAR